MERFKNASVIFLSRSALQCFLHKGVLYDLHRDTIFEAKPSEFVDIGYRHGRSISKVEIVIFTKLLLQLFDSCCLFSLIHLTPVLKLSESLWDQFSRLGSS